MQLNLGISFVGSPSDEQKPLVKPMLFRRIVRLKMLPHLNQMTLRLAIIVIANAEVTELTCCKMKSLAK
jgi:hypothetical protein